MTRVEFVSRGDHGTQTGVSSGKSHISAHNLFWSDVTLLATVRVCASFKVIELGMLITHFTLLTMTDLIVRESRC
jgi:hypothetical protein